MRIPLLGGAYSDASLIAGAQRSVNVYSEKNPAPAQSPVPVTQYPRPGLSPLSAPPAVGRGRALYTATNGDGYAVIDTAVYYIDPDFVFHLLGNLGTVTETPVSMSDNSDMVLIVDGDESASTIDITPVGTGGPPSRAFALLGDPNFLGADRVDFLDGFLVMNQPNTKNWYCTVLYSQLAAPPIFNGLFIGTKTAWPDNVVCVVTCERQAWVFGRYKSEIWTNVGAVPFPFQITSGNIVEHGCVARFSAAKADTLVYWLSQSPEGARLAMKGEGNGAVRVSTHAIETEWLKYPRVDDAIGQTYQLGGHLFYVLSFPTADKTWVFDQATTEWHEVTSIDFNGIEHRWRAGFLSYMYGRNVALDWSTGQLYQIDPDNFTDNGQPIVFRRGFPHMMDGENFDRVSINHFIADMQCGTSPGFSQNPQSTSPWSGGFSPGFGPRIIVEPPLVSLRISRDRGYSFGNPVMKPMGAQGQYKTRPTWYHCGYANDFIFELFWSTPMKTALNGAFIDAENHEMDA